MSQFPSGKKSIIFPEAWKPYARSSVQREYDGWNWQSDVINRCPMALNRLNEPPPPIPSDGHRNVNCKSPTHSIFWCISSRVIRAQRSHPRFNQPKFSVTSSSAASLRRRIKPEHRGQNDFGIFCKQSYDIRREAGGNKCKNIKLFIKLAYGKGRGLISLRLGHQGGERAGYRYKRCGGRVNLNIFLFVYPILWPLLPDSRILAFVFNTGST